MYTHYISAWPARQLQPPNSYILSDDISGLLALMLAAGGALIFMPDQQSVLGKMHENAKKAFLSPL